MVGEKAPMLGKNLPVGHQRRLRQTGQHAISNAIPAVAGRRPRPLHDLPTSALRGGLKAGRRQHGPGAPAVERTPGGSGTSTRHATKGASSNGWAADATPAFVSSGPSSPIRARASAEARGGDGDPCYAGDMSNNVKPKPLFARLALLANAVDVTADAAITTVIGAGRYTLARAGDHPLHRSRPTRPAADAGVDSNVPRSGAGVRRALGGPLFERCPGALPGAACALFLQ
jgi:hypothetical protein